MRTWADLFTNRQLTTLVTCGSLISDAREKIIHDGGPAEYAAAVATYLSFAVNRVAMSANSLVRWNPVGEKAQHMFARQAVSMLWDYQILIRRAKQRAASKLLT